MFAKTHVNAEIRKEISKQWIQNKPSLEMGYYSTVVYGGDILGYHFFEAPNDNLEA